MKIIKKTYCDDCPEFDAVSSRMYSGGSVVEVTIECENREKCDRIERYIRERLEACSR